MRLKKILVILILHFSVFVLHCSAQQVPELWGMTPTGGSAFKVYGDGTNFLDFHDFNNNTGGYPEGYFTIYNNNGILYGVAKMGGAYDSGVIFSIDTSTFTYTVLYNFSGPLGTFPNGSLLLGSNNKFYGTTNSGGNNRKGVIFSFDPSTNIYSVEHYFTDTTYCSVATLMQANNGLIYGSLWAGGTHHHGLIYSYDPVTSVYNDIYNLDTTIFVTNSSSPRFIQATNGLIYGLGAVVGNIGGGEIFSLNPNTNILQILYRFDTSNAIGVVPHGSLIQANNGLLYGMTWYGGSTGCGGIFSFDISTNTCINVYNFSYPTGKNPTGSLMQASDGKLYGMARLGGLNNKGTLFQYDLITNTYTDIHDFNGSDGSLPTSDLIEFPCTLKSLTTSSNSSMCLGDSIVLHVNGAINYHWYPGNFTDSIITVHPTATTTYLVTGSVNLCSKTDTIIITIIPPITVTSSFTADTLKGCAPLTIQFTNTSSNGVHYLWNFGDGGTSTAVNPVHTYSDSGKYTVTLTATNDTSQCGRYVNTKVKTNYIEVGSPIQVTSRFTASTVFGCVPLEVDFTNTSINGTTFHWLLGNGETDTAKNPHHIIYPDSGTFHVTLIAYNESPLCANSPDVWTVDINTGICDLEFPNVFSPNGDDVNDYFQFLAKGYTHCKLIIFNRWGQLIYESPLTDTFWNGKINNTEAEVHDGTYYYLFTATDFYGKAFAQKGFITVIR